MGWRDYADLAPPQVDKVDKVDKVKSSTSLNPLNPLNPLQVPPAPIWATGKRRPTVEEVAELQRLVGIVSTHHAFRGDERAEALEIALSDPEAALECFRELVREIRR